MDRAAAAAVTPKVRDNSDFLLSVFLCMFLDLSEIRDGFAVDPEVHFDYAEAHAKRVHTNFLRTNRRTQTSPGTGSDLGMSYTHLAGGLVSSEE